METIKKEGDFYKEMRKQQKQTFESLDFILFFGIFGICWGLYFIWLLL